MNADAAGTGPTEEALREPGDVRRGAPRRVSKVSEVVAHEIVADMIADGLGPGDALPSESQMLEHYDVGRGSLREALRILEVYGLITIKAGPGGGPVICELGPRNLARALTLHFSASDITYGQLLESSRLLQVALVSRAAQLRQEDQLEQMRRALRGMDTDDEAAFGRATHAFHKAAVNVPGGQLLVLLFDALHEIMLLRLKHAISLGEARPTVAEHQAIAAAISSGDADAAAARMHDHLTALAELYERRFPGLAEERVDWA